MKWSALALVGLVTPTLVQAGRRPAGSDCKRHRQCASKVCHDGLCACRRNKDCPDSAQHCLGSGACSQLSPYRRLAAAEWSACVLDRPDGAVGFDGMVCWGASVNNELGLGDTQDRDATGAALPPPARVALPARMKHLVAGHDQFCSLSTDAKVYCWGRNVHGELGLGDFEPRNGLPLKDMPPLPLPRVAHVAVGHGHACAISEGGKLFCWGWNRLGQLGLGDTQDRSVPHLVKLRAAVVLVACGGDHTCVTLAQDKRGRGGAVVCFGRNAGGQLGVGDTKVRGAAEPANSRKIPHVPLHSAAIELRAGTHESCARLEGGDIVCWGRNRDGQLGVGDVQSRGTSPDDVLGPVPLPGPAVAFSQLTGSVCALMASGAPVCWGRNKLAQLGVGDTANRGAEPADLPLPALPLQQVVEVAAGSFFSCVLHADDVARCWGLEHGHGGHRAEVLVLSADAAQAAAVVWPSD